MPGPKRPRLILVTNDDGYDAEGITVLFRRLQELGEAFMVAPDREKSATSLALTLRDPLRVRQAGPRAFAVEGTPADCVYLAANTLLPRRPDLVVSGINHGPNLGQQDISYSGTVAGAVQGTYFGIPSLAVSATPDSGKRFPFDLAAEIALQLAGWLLSGPPAPGITLNLNVPPPPFKGLRLAKLGWKQYSPDIVEKEDPRSRPYFWIGLGKPKVVGDVGTDLEAVRSGFASLTPLHSDMTHYDSLGHPALRSLESDVRVPKTAG